MKVSNEHKQKFVDHLFDTNASYWNNTYKANDFYAIIYQRRQAVALRYIDELPLSENARVLEIGCGAGFLTVALAKRGFNVQAIDHSKAMINMTMEHVRQAGFENRINTDIGDVHKLSYENDSFDLIVALGVIPWLHNFRSALNEMIRILSSNGYMVLTVDNALRLSQLLDPLTFPLFSIFRKWGRYKLEKARLLTPVNKVIGEPTYNQHSPREFETNLQLSGLTIVKKASVGFGPFTFLGHNLFAEKTGIKIQQRLQTYADAKYPVVRNTGSHYIVLAQKK